MLHDVKHQSLWKIWQNLAITVLRRRVSFSCPKMSNCIAAPSSWMIVGFGFLSASDRRYLIYESLKWSMPSVAFKASLMVMPLLFSRSDQTVFVGLARNKARRETLTSQHSREIDRLEATAAIVRFNQPPVVPLYCLK